VGELLIGHPREGNLMASKKKKSTSAGVDEQLDAVATATTAATTDAPPADVAGQFVGQWNRLVSTTNWEKGRIICQWREALELAGAAVTAYSDEAWSQLVGNVTSQHVGRLRRVFQRFGAVFDQYEGLYWSHFQAGLDWDDAEMWLEGAIRNDWSVSQMRGKRWETLGNAGDPPPDAAAASELDEDATAPDGEAASAAVGAAKTAQTPPWEAPVNDAEGSDEESAESTDDESDESAAAAPKSKSRKSLAVDVDDLPDDLADAFEQFKLAIIAQRRLGWSETTPAAVMECLDALRELALAPADD
jgi:hypothetical protein